jgi:hypothetical protein
LKQAPDDWLHSKFLDYWDMGYNDKRIAEELTKDIREDKQLDSNKYSIRYAMS